MKRREFFKLLAYAPVAALASTLPVLAESKPPLSQRELIQKHIWESWKERTRRRMRALIFKFDHPYFSDATIDHIMKGGSQ